MMMLNGKRFNILSISDTHLGNSDTPELIDALDTIIVSVVESGKEPLDIIILGGDVYDKLKTLEDSESILIQEWILRLIRLCSIHNVMLRVLEGTPSHDRRQSKQFVVLAEAVKDIFPCDVKYITQIDIEYIEKYGVYVLYVPDEASPDTNQTLSIIKDKMANIGISQVDYAVVHSGFDFHYPVQSKAHKHSSDQYLKLVRKYILVAHIHQNSITHKKFLTNGSFGRHSHGDEGRKGCWLIYNTVGGMDSDKIYFLENKKATVYKTIYLMDENLAEIINNSILPYSNSKNVSIRIRSDNTNAISLSRTKLPKLFPMVKWSFELTGQKEEHIQQITPVTFTPLILIKATLPDIILDRIGELGDKTMIKELLSEVL